MSGSHPIALMVKSRRRAASSKRHRRIAFDGESFVSAPGLRFAPRQRDVDIAELVDRKCLADGLDAAERAQQGEQRLLRNAEHLDVEILRRRFRRRSRTNPPTHSARPPASRTALAIRDACVPERCRPLSYSLWRARQVIGRRQDVHAGEGMQHQQILVARDDHIGAAVRPRLRERRRRGDHGRRGST